jgi:hypothetical protein
VFALSACRKNEEKRTLRLVGSSNPEYIRQWYTSLDLIVRFVKAIL